MALDPCEDGCINHNIGANTVPVAGDDPCNTAGNGIYCAGSYWLYDPTAAGADPNVDGDCPRLFLRTGGDCVVDQWLEIHVAEMISETRDPVDGDDCCQPGTIWENTARSAGAFWISTNNGGNCTWCRICIPHNLEAPALPTAAACNDGYTLGSIWRVPAGTFPGQNANLTYHLVNDDLCTWCRMCGSSFLSMGDGGVTVPANIPDSTTTLLNFGAIGFDTLGEAALPGIVTILDGSRFQWHVEIQGEVVNAAARTVLRVGHSINGGGVTFWPVTQSFHNLGGNTQINLTGNSPTISLQAGDTIEWYVSHFGSGGNFILSSIVVNFYDLPHAGG